MKRRILRKKPKPGGLLLVLLIALFTTAASGFWVFNSRIRPMILSISEAEALNMATESMNRAISETIASGNFAYDRLIVFEKDGSGEISAVKTNVILVNLMKTRLSEELFALMGGYLEEGFSIPLGTVMGLNFFSGKGPDIPIQVLLTDTIHLGFVSCFDGAGINQTRHRIILTATVSFDIILPGETLEAETASSALVSETILIGEVPNSYAYFGETETASEAVEDYYNFFVPGD